MLFLMAGVKKQRILFSLFVMLFDLGLNVSTQVNFRRICMESSEFLATRPLGYCSFQNIPTNLIISQTDTLLSPYIISYYSSAFTILIPPPRRRSVRSIASCYTFDSQATQVLR